MIQFSISCLVFSICYRLVSRKLVQPNEAATTCNWEGRSKNQKGSPTRTPNKNTNKNKTKNKNNSNNNKKTTKKQKIHKTSTPMERVERLNSSCFLCCLCCWLLSLSLSWVLFLISQQNQQQHGYTAGMAQLCCGSPVWRRGNRHPPPSYRYISDFWRRPLSVQTFSIDNNSI